MLSHYLKKCLHLRVYCVKASTKLQNYLFSPFAAVLTGRLYSGPPKNCGLSFMTKLLYGEVLILHTLKIQLNSRQKNRTRVFQPTV